MPEPIFIALGTNLGDRAANLAKAIAALPPEVAVVRESSIYLTPPWGYADQPEFYNQTLEARTSLSPRGLLYTLKTIEREMGRTKTFRYGPRIIDLDILFFGDQVIQEDDLQIPHPRLQERAFVLAPMQEIAPKFIHPVLHKSIEDLLAEVDAEGVRQL